MEKEIEALYVKIDRIIKGRAGLYVKECRLLKMENSPKSVSELVEIALNEYMENHRIEKSFFDKSH